jgi:hypothetical protein
MSDSEEENMLNNNFIFKIVDLEINPFSTPKAAKRALKEILREYEYDDDFIDNINDDIAIGYAVAIDIIKRTASEEIHK